VALKFAVSSDKAVDALAFVASVEPGMTPKYVSKVMFYAEKWHLNRYGRPIFADTYIAMPQGPVPSTVKNFIDENWLRVEKPEKFDEKVRIEVSKGLRRLHVTGGPDLNRLSQSDQECLADAVKFCLALSPDELSSISHEEKSWLNADTNRPMDYVDFIDDDNPHRDQVIECAIEASRSVVL